MKMLVDDDADEDDKVGKNAGEDVGGDEDEDKEMQPSVSRPRRKMRVLDDSESE